MGGLRWVSNSIVQTAPRMMDVVWTISDHFSAGRHHGFNQRGCDSSVATIAAAAAATGACTGSDGACSFNTSEDMSGRKFQRMF